MLYIELPDREMFDELSSTFITYKKESLQLEHSLVSLSKWESKWEKPFLGRDKKTTEEELDYIRCMTITQNIDYNSYNSFPNWVFKRVDDYINAPMTATWFSDKSNRPTSSEIITAEIIYYWMISLGIPFECQKWHLNRLLTLIRVCNIKNTPSKKAGLKNTVTSRNALNELRKKMYNTKG